MNAGPPDADSFADLRAAISAMASSQCPPPTGSRPEELRLLYTQRQEWARHYNGLIWSVTAILLPVALGGLALSFRNDAGDLHTSALAFAAFGSSLLLIFWNMICDRHRTLWEREFKIVHVIEAAWGLRAMPLTISESGEPLLSTGSRHVKRIRNAIACLGIATWVARVLVELAA